LSRTFKNIDSALDCDYVLLAMTADPSQLLGRTLVLVAHPDDEAAGCGVLLQRMRDPVVLFCTDGAPRDEYFWRHHGSRAAYAQLRRAEASAALAHAGVSRVDFLESPAGQNLFVDQELFRCLAPAAEQIENTIDRVNPDALLTLAYEGGHPDHDSCALLAATMGRGRGIPVWEFPLYHRNAGEQPVVQRFVNFNGEEVEIEPTVVELERKRQMFREYRSQGNILGTFAVGREPFRPMAQYDFTQPPHPGRTNYECWRWRMSCSEVTAAFRAWLASK
jgi:N-acetylglucosamine malate deacetylase 2